MDFLFIQGRNAADTLNKPIMTHTTKLFVFIIQKWTIRIQVTHSVTWYAFPSGTPKVIARTAGVR